MPRTSTARRFPLPWAVALAAAVAGAGACDSDFGGALTDNLSPETSLSVRDSSLVDNLNDEDRLSSSVFVSWSGDDPDGFVAGFELRFFDEDVATGPDAGWTFTTSPDTLVLLPIPRGDRDANVVFEVRAVDNEDSRDPTPARTVFPIRNAPPTIRFSQFDLPPDTTFGIFSYVWIADDPEGPENLQRIEVSFNDSLSFVDLPPDVEYATFVADVDRSDPLQTETEARLYTGRGFARTDIFVPGLRLDDTNTLYVRAVDFTDTSSVRIEHAWHVKKSRGEVLYINDYRKSSFPVIQDFHYDLLVEYLPAGTGIDYWDLSRPFVSGSGGNVPRSNALPPSAAPTLQQMLADYRYIYWVSTNGTSSATRNNLPFAAGVLDLFFDAGGKIMVHSPVILPASSDETVDNPAILMLPFEDFVSFPDSLRPGLRLNTGVAVSPLEPLPGVSQTLPELKIAQIIINALPYEAGTSDIIPVYGGEFQYITQSGNRGPWFGSPVVASVSADRRVGFFSVPIINEQSGNQLVTGAADDDEDVRVALKLLLESLEFPKR